MRFLLQTFLVAALLTSPLSAADNTADEADVAFRLGNAAFQRGNFEQALASYFLSYRLVPNANVLFNIARCYEALEEFDEAYRYYNDLAAMKIAAEDRRDVDRALVRIRPRVALIRVTTEPVPADIFIDREDLGSRGRTPQTLALPPGKHLVRVKAQGYYPSETQVTLVRGREATAALELVQITGTVQLSGWPESAWIRATVDGPVLSTLPGRVSLPPGRRVLYVGAEGFATAQVLVEVEEKKVTPVTVTLNPLPQPSGKLVVVANRENATIRVDGKPGGFTPTVLTLPEGEHVIEISYPDLKTFEKKVTVKADAEDKLVAELRYAPPPVQAASKTLLTLDEAPASTTVISGEEIRSFGYTTLGEALQAVRGVFISNDRMYQKVGVRGLAPPGDLNNRVLILWDGHSMNDVWAGQGYAGRDLSVDLAEVDRIEVVRGPGSALYGSGAFFAVINIVPRSRLPSNANVEVLGAAGGLGSYRARVSGAMNLGEDGSLMLSAAAYDAFGAELTELGDRGVVRGLDGERGQTVTARARYGAWSFSGLFTRRGKDIPTGPYDTLLHEPGTAVQDLRGFAELRFEPKLGPGQLSLRAYFDGSHYDGTWLYPSDDPDATGNVLSTDSGGAQWVGSEARYHFRLFNQNQLTVGLEAQLHLSIEQEAFGTSGKAALEPHRGSVLSAYVLDEWRVLPQLSVSAGLRVDRYSLVDAMPVTPRLAVIARPYAQGITKLVAGSAFRAPNVYELYYHDGGATQRPAESLTPETIATFEVEHAHDLSEELRLTVGGYHNRITHLVETVYEEGENCSVGGEAQACLVNANVADLLPTFGAEAELRWQPSPAMMVNLSYSRVWITYPRAAGEAARATGAPTHLVAGRVLVPVDPSVRLSLQGTYQSERVLPDDGGTLPELLLLNVGVAGDLGRLRYFAGVTNLLDQKAVPVLSTVAPASLDAVSTYGRGFLLQLTAAY